ncbi:hypothetical protein A3C87_01940 [Candidatus Kaiserbacteria bacterium RIFCSPHIGHO2_02_FULL_49_34]|uniref:Uncharacterized protein n=1 Tax=Candidatus Kaiserbacteria bacterium RIFCSPHIGHO2_02_FULL_49_34 TaxID=1798491 RepID=A0A1F6DI25_9BACT|nr:MAG: hypothetical protein A3C87_01940 [Candidatus Kaiserbacteria bacterium RIFCSPHIGHO2_02_FULL_49_34]
MKVITLTIAAIVALSGLAYFLTRGDTPDAPYAVGDTPTIEQVSDMLRGVTMQVPVGDTKTDIIIDSYASHDTVVFGGVSEEGEDTVTVFIPEFTDALQKGAWGIVNDNYVLIPTYINYGGTGQFFMIALFSYNAETGTLTHRDLHFVNDRIAYDGMIQSSDAHVTLYYRTHAEGEAMTDEPTLEATRTLEITGNTFSIID